MTVIMQVSSVPKIPQSKTNFTVLACHAVWCQGLDKEKCDKGTKKRKS